MICDRVIQPVCILEMCVFHAECLGAGIHLRDKRLLAACDKLGKRDGAVICRGDDHALDHLLHRHFLADLQIDLGAAHGCRVLADRHHVVELDLSRVDRLHHEQQRHDLGDRGGRQRLIRILFKQHAPGGRLHKHGAPAFERCGEFRRADRRGKHCGKTKQK